MHQLELVLFLREVNGKENEMVRNKDGIFQCDRIFENEIQQA